MQRLCPVVINCPGVDLPVLNLSAEAPDPFVFESVFYPPIPHECLTCDPSVVYQSRGCHGIVFSATSQEQADLLARLTQAICKEPGSQQFTNDPQTATVVCPTGSVFSYTVPAASITVAADPDPDAWLAASNAAALAYAQQQASRQEQMCCVITTHLLPHPGWMCVGEPLIYGATNQYKITGLNSAGTWNFSLLSGALPPGISLTTINNNTAAITGTATTPGVYTYTIEAIRPAVPWISVTVTDTLAVFGITNPTLPDGGTNTDYSEQIVTAGGTDPVLFSANPADLPDGLSMDSAGLITGAPTTVETRTFNVTIIDAEGKNCVQPVTIAIKAIVPVACDWPSILAQLTAPGSCAASANPAWDGVFNLSTTFLGETIFYFINQSILGQKVAASDGVNYPGGAWQLTPYTNLVWNGASWTLQIACISGGAIWYGTGDSVNPLDASGIYTFVVGASAGPSTIQVIKNGADYCMKPGCVDWTQLAWAAAGITNGSFTPDSTTGDSFTCAENAGVSQSFNHAFVPYSGLGCNCNLHLVLLGGTTLPGPSCSVSVRIVAPSTSLVCVKDIGAGTYDIPFAIPSSGGATVSIRVDVSPSPSTGPFTITGKFTNL